MKKLIQQLNKYSRMSFLLMLVVGGYLLYAIYQMNKGLPSLETSPVPVYLFMGIFALCSLVLISVAVFALAGGHYRENSLTTNTDDDTDVEENQAE